MSDITDLKKKQKIAATQKYGAQPANTGALWADMDLVEDLETRVHWMCNDRVIDGVAVPRFGLLTLLLRTSPTYVYGHPAMKKLCKTAFTDGLHVFICDEFYEKLLKDERENKSEYGIEPLIMHELMHKMHDHVYRFHQFPAEMANRAADLSINTKLKAAFPEIEWSKSLRETGLGFKPGDIEKYLNLSEESICRELLNEELKKQKECGDGQGQGKGQGKGKGKGKGQGKGQGKGDPSDGDGDPSEGDPEFGGEGDNHLVDLKDLIETLEEAGLDEVKELLDLPDSGNVEEIGRVQEESQDRVHEAIQQAAAQASQNGGKYPGKEIVDAANEYLKGFGKGKLEWKLAMRELVLGDGMKFRKSFELFSDIAYVDEVTEKLGTPLYLPVELPHKSESCVLVLVDTSGSVSTETLRQFITEILELVSASESMGDNASEVVVIAADTVLRNMIVITPENVDEFLSQGVNMQGRTGTNLTTALKNALAMDIMKEKKIESVAFFTDLYDSPPKKEDLNLPNEGTSIVFIAPESTDNPYQEEFAKAVESYARVVTLRAGEEVDLDDTMSMGVSTRRMKAK